MIHKDGKKIHVTDHAAQRYAERYCWGLDLEAARERLGDALFHSSAKLLPDLSPQGDQMWLLPALDCVVVVKQDERTGYESDYVVPTVLPNPTRKITHRPLAGLAKLRELVPQAPEPAQAAEPPSKPLEAPAVPEPEPPAEAPAEPVRVERPDLLREAMEDLVASLRTRSRNLRSSVAASPSLPGTFAWVDRQLTLASEVWGWADELDRILSKCDE